MVELGSFGRERVTGEARRHVAVGQVQRKEVEDATLAAKNEL